MWYEFSNTIKSAKCQFKEHKNPKWQMKTQIDGRNLGKSNETNA